MVQLVKPWIDVVYHLVISMVWSLFHSSPSDLKRLNHNSEVLSIHIRFSFQNIAWKLIFWMWVHASQDRDVNSYSHVIILIEQFEVFEFGFRSLMDGFNSLQEKKQGPKKV